MTDIPDQEFRVYNDGYSKRKKSQYKPTIQKIYDSTSRPFIPKVVAFDLDETIGNFADLYLLWTAIFTQGIYKGIPDKTTTQNIFNELLDLYPEFLRYGIIDILEFIQTKIHNGESHRIYIYTNNQCDFSACPTGRMDGQPSPTEWVEMIIVYLNWKLNVSDTIFAKPICAFKINDRIIEPLRETTSKTHRDFLKCTILPPQTEICFVDDYRHSRMIHNKVYYIQPPPYLHELTRYNILDRFLQSNIYNHLVNKRNVLRSLETMREFTTSTVHVSHKESYHKLMYYIKEFFCIATRCAPSRRRKTHIGRFTRKKR